MAAAKKAEEAPVEAVVEEAPVEVAAEAVDPTVVQPAEGPIADLERALAAERAKLVTVVPATTAMTAEEATTEAVAGLSEGEE